MSEQDTRIMEALQDYYNNPGEYSFQELEDIFEDRDPFEFI